MNHLYMYPLISLFNAANPEQFLLKNNCLTVKI